MAIKVSKVAVITGASRGIGEATAIAFATKGYDIVLGYKQDTEAANRVAGQVLELGQNAVVAKADISKQAGVEALFSVIRKNHKSIDVFINNAAAINEPEFGQYDHMAVAGDLADNFGASVMCTQEAAKMMTKGSILFTSSIYGMNFGGSVTFPLYSAAKAAMINFAQTMAEVLSPDIRCNIVAPGATLTEHWQKAKPEYVERHMKATLLKEFIEPEEIANAFVFLAETPHITGQTIVIDAGWQKKIRDNSPPRPR